MTSRQPDPRIIGILVVIIACLSFGRAGDAASDPAPDVAGLVIDYGNGTQTYALIPLGNQTLTGLDLLERSGLDLLTLGSGGWGVAVCAIEDVGCDLSACRARLCQTSDPTSPYWQYLRAPDDPGSAWAFSNQGASSSTITGGEVYAWFWLGTRPTTPAVTIDEIAARLDVSLASVKTEPVIRTFGSLPRAAAEPPSVMAVLASSGVVLVTAGIGVVVIRRSRTATR